MIDKKKLFKCIIIISLIIIIIIASVQIRKTLARYETTTTSEKDVDVAFSIIDNDFKTERLLIKDIYPRETAFEYTFTVSNYISSTLGDKIAETDLEYDIILTSTTFLPLSYELQRNGTTCLNIVHTDATGLYTDTDGTYYREMKTGTIENPYPFTIDTIIEDKDGNGNGKGTYSKTKVTDTFILKVTFPQTFSSEQEYRDIIEDIQIELTARQKI